MKISLLIIYYVIFCKEECIMFDTKICAECGQVFLATVNWLYKLRKKPNSTMNYYCSYKCWRKNGGDGGVRVIKN